MSAYCSAVVSTADAAMAITVSAIAMSSPMAPHVPTRTSRVAPSCTSSSYTIPADGHPMPVDCTLIGAPSNVPV